MSPKVIFQNGEEVSIKGGIIVNNTLSEVRIRVSDETAQRALEAKLESGNVKISGIFPDSFGMVDAQDVGIKFTGSGSPFSPKDCGFDAFTLTRVGRLK